MVFIHWWKEYTYLGVALLIQSYTGQKNIFAKRGGAEDYIYENYDRLLVPPLRLGQICSRAAQGRLAGKDLPN